MRLARVHFALDICNMPSLLFTGFPVMMQIFPFMKRDYPTSIDFGHRKRNHYAVDRAQRNPVLV
jgi:hypothetical protein